MISLSVRATPSNKVLIANVSCYVVFLMSATSVLMYKRIKNVMPPPSKEPTNCFPEE